MSPPMRSAADNELLTRTGAGTPMGEYFRRYWQPVALCRELPEPDCPPIRVKVLGETIVDRLHSEVASAMADAAVRARFTEFITKAGITIEQ